MKSLSLKTKMALAVSLLFVLVIVLLAWGALSYQERSLKKAICRQQFALVSSLAKNIDDKLGLAQTALIAAGRQMPPEALRAADRAQRFLDARATLHSVFDNGLFLISGDGKLIAESPFLPGRRGRDLSSREFFRQTVTTGKPSISKPYTSSHTPGHPAIFISAPVVDRQGRLLAILGGSFDLLGSNFLEDLSRTRYSDASYFYLTDRDRTIIVHPDRNRILTKALPAGLNLLYEKALTGFEGSGETVTSKGIRVISSVQHLRTTGWILAANYPTTEAYAPLITARRYFLLAALGITIAVLAITWLLMKRLTAPLEAFTRHVESLPENFGRHPFLNIESGDEIGVMAQAFNRMVTTLETQQSANEARLGALLRLNEMSASSLKEIADFALEEAVRLTRSTIGYVAFVNDDESLLTMYSWSREAMRECAIADKPLEYPLASTGLWGEAVRQRRPVITNDYAAPSPYKKGYPEGHVNVRRHMNVPVFDGERTVIIAGVGNKDAAYDETDVHQLTLLMQGMWRLIQRRRMDEALRESEEQYRRIVETSQEGIWAIDTEERTTYVNRRMADILGYSGEEMVGRPLLDFVDHSSRTDILDHIERRKVGRQSRYEAVMLHRDGRKIWVSIAGAPIIDLDGLFNGSFAMISDITERKEAETEIELLNTALAARAAELEVANRELEAFNYTVSHDLRIPLTGLNGYCEMLLEQSAGQLDSRCADYAREIHEAAQYMDQLISTLLEFSRLSHCELHRAEVNLSALARTVAAELRMNDLERPATFTIAEGAVVNGDAQLLRIVMENLLGNAWKYTGNEEAALIEFGAAETEDGKAWFVRDNGPGFDMADADRLFKPFQRLPGATAAFRGHGIGLATVQRIVERHGGRVWAEGAPGKGATFFFTL